MHFSAKERTILRIVQEDLPDSLTPYADLAKTCDLTEAEVLNLLQRLKAEGVIRRFGASIRHQRTGWTHNVMVAWKVNLDVLEECGKKATTQERISHVYYRPVVTQNWPYNFYTMIHGKSAEECEEVISQLVAESPLNEHLALYSLKELKKTSMLYFA